MQVLSCCRGAVGLGLRQVSSSHLKKPQIVCENPCVTCSFHLPCAVSTQTHLHGRHTLPPPSLALPQQACSGVRVLLGDRWSAEAGAPRVRGIQGCRLMRIYGRRVQKLVKEQSSLQCGF